MPDPPEWLTAQEATSRLGVRPQTLYAYVSRGLVDRQRTPGGRTSRYRRSDVDQLASRSRGGGRRTGRLDVVVDTELTLLDPAGRLAYRGWDAADAARQASFEEVAAWLWTGVRREESAW